MNHTHHTHFVHHGQHKAAIVTNEYGDGSVDLVYFNGGADATPHAAQKVKHSDLEGEGTFHHHAEHTEGLAAAYAYDESLLAKKEADAALASAKETE